MAKPMKRRTVDRALRKQRCLIRKPDRGPHTTWICPCGQHTADIPRGTSKDVSSGVIGDTIDRMKCLPEGWLQ